MRSDEYIFQPMQRKTIPIWWSRNYEKTIYSLFGKKNLKWPWSYLMQMNFLVKAERMNILL